MQQLVQSSVRGRIHQSSSVFSAFSRGRQCTPISYFAVLYSSVYNVDTWTPATIDFVLSQGDSMYRSVRHSQEYFDYTELPLSVYLSHSHHQLSCQFFSHHSNFLHCTASNAVTGSLCLADAVRQVCAESRGCLVTANGTTVAIIQSGNNYYLFDSHCRDHLGRSTNDGTAVLLQFSSPEDIQCHMRRLHGIFSTSTRECNAWADHDRRCQFDVVGITANVDTPQVIGVPEATSHGAASVPASSVVSVTVSNISSTSSVSTVRSYASVVSGVGVNTQSSSSAVHTDVCDVTSESSTSTSRDLFTENTAPVNVSGSVPSTSNVSVPPCSYASVTSGVRKRKNTVSADVCPVTSPSSTSTVAGCAVYSAKYRCVQCDVVCKSRQALRMHHTRVHSKNSTSTVSTDVCAVPTSLPISNVSTSGSMSTSNLSTGVSGVTSRSAVGAVVPTGSMCVNVSHVTSAESVGTVPTGSMPVDVSNVKSASSVTTMSLSSVSTDVSGHNTAWSTSTGTSFVVVADECRCVECGVLFKNKQSVRMHHIRVHSKKVHGIAKGSTQQTAVTKKSSTSTVSTSTACTDVCAVPTSLPTSNVSTSGTMSPCSVSVAVGPVKSASSVSAIVPSSSVSVDVHGVKPASSTSTGTSSVEVVDEYKCVQCGAVFTNKAAVRLHHMRVHSKKVSIISNYSTEQNVVSTTDAANVHVMSTVKSRKPTCVACGAVFNSKCALNNHQRKMHSKKVSRPIATNTSKQCFSIPLQNRYSSLSSVAEDITEQEQLSDSSCGEPPKKAAKTNGTHGKRLRSETGQSELPPRSSPRRSQRNSQKTQTGIGVLPAQTAKTIFRPASQQCNDCGKVFVNLTNHKKCSKKLVSGGETVQESSRTYKQPSRITGNTRKQRTQMRQQAELKELKNILKKKVPKERNPLLEKLTNYHNDLSLQVDNILTEKVTGEVKDVVAELSEIDDVSREFRWSDADQERLNQLNAQAKKLQTPGNWTWAAKEGTDQYEYNHKRLQYFVEQELQSIVKHCDQCQSTGILVGLDQIDSTCCYDCLAANMHRGRTAEAEKQKAWESVRPKSMEYPKTVEKSNGAAQNTMSDLPLLYPGEKAIIAPVHPVVTVCKNYIANKKLRQESITLNPVSYTHLTLPTILRV